MTQLYFTAAVVAFVWALVFALMQVAHVYWRDLDFRVRYVIGTAICCAGMTIAGLLLADALLMIVPWALTSAGATVLINYHVEAKRRERERAAQRHGEIVGAARGLTQEIIDRGSRGTNTPGHDN